MRPSKPRERKTGRLSGRASSDSQSIYGTRTAHRIRSAKQRRTEQNLRALALTIVCVVAAWWWLRAQRVPTFKPQWSRAIAVAPSAPAAVAVSGNDTWLLQPSDSGMMMPILAVNGATGKPFCADLPLRAQPEVAENVAFLPCEDGVLRAVDWTRGALLWSAPTSASLTTHPVAVPLDASTRAVIAANDDGEVVACDAKTGRVLWRRAAGAPAGNALVATKIKGEAAVLVPLLGGLGTRGGLLALAARDGRVLWKSELGAARLATPVVEIASGKSGASTRGAIYSAGDDGSIFRLDLDSGKKLEGGGWKSGKVFAAPLENASPENAVVLRGEALLQSYSWGAIYAIGGNDGAVRCYDAKSAALLWTFDAGFPVRFRPVPLRLNNDGKPMADNSAEVAARDLLLVSGDGATIFALDAKSGAAVWRFAGDGDSTAAPLRLGNSLLRLSSRGSLQSFQLP